MKTSIKVAFMALIAIGTGVGIAYAVVTHSDDVVVFDTDDTFLDIKTDSNNDISALRIWRERSSGNAPGAALLMVGDTSTGHAILDIVVNSSVSVTAARHRGRITLDSNSEGIITLATGEFDTGGAPLAAIVLDSDGGTTGVSEVYISSDKIRLESETASIDITEGGDVIITLGS